MADKVSTNPAKLVDALEVTGAALEKAARDYQIKEAQVREIESKIPSTLESLMVAGIVLPEEKEAAEKILRDPVQTLALLKLASDSFGKAQNGNNSLPATAVDANGNRSEKKASAKRDWQTERDEQWRRDMQNNGM